MVWKSHQAVTAVTVYAVTRNIPATIIATMASVFPDWIEFHIPFINWESFHRTYCHFWAFYAIPLIALYLFMGAVGIPLFGSGAEFSKSIFSLKVELSGSQPFYMAKDFPPIVCNVGFWFLIGCLMHIAEDAICGRIPITHPTQRAHLIRFFYTGGLGEAMFVGIYCLFVGIFIFKGVGHVSAESFQPTRVVQSLSQGSADMPKDKVGEKASVEHVSLRAGDGVSQSGGMTAEEERFAKVLDAKVVKAVLSGFLNSMR